MQSGRGPPPPPKKNKNHRPVPHQHQNNKQRQHAGANGDDYEGRQDFSSENDSSVDSHLTNQMRTRNPVVGAGHNVPRQLIDALKGRATEEQEGLNSANVFEGMQGDHNNHQNYHHHNNDHQNQRHRYRTGRNHNQDDEPETDAHHALRSNVSTPSYSASAEKRAEEEAMRADTELKTLKDAVAVAKLSNIIKKNEKPDGVIGKEVIIHGDFHYDHLLRIDGRFEGNLISRGSLIIGKKGVLIGNAMNLKYLVVEGGKITGDISVDALVLKHRSELLGNISCRSFEVMDGAVVKILGKVNIHSRAPAAHSSLEPIGQHRRHEDELGNAGAYGGIYSEVEDASSSILEQQRQRMQQQHQLFHGQYTDGGKQNPAAAAASSSSGTVGDKKGGGSAAAGVAVAAVREKRAAQQNKEVGGHTEPALLVEENAAEFAERQRQAVLEAKRKRRAAKKLLREEALRKIEEENELKQEEARQKRKEEEDEKEREREKKREKNRASEIEKTYKEEKEKPEVDARDPKKQAVGEGESGEDETISDKTGADAALPARTTALAPALSEGGGSTQQLPRGSVDTDGNITIRATPTSKDIKVPSLVGADETAAPSEVVVVALAEPPTLRADEAEGPSGSGTDNANIKAPAPALSHGPDAPTASVGGGVSTAAPDAAIKGSEAVQNQQAAPVTESETLTATESEKGSVALAAAAASVGDGDVSNVRDGTVDGPDASAVSAGIDAIAAANASTASAADATSDSNVSVAVNNSETSTEAEAEAGAAGDAGAVGESTAHPTVVSAEESVAPADQNPAGESPADVSTTPAAVPAQQEATAENAASG